jgi:hypothetical protein
LGLIFDGVGGVGIPAHFRFAARADLSGAGDVCHSGRLRWRVVDGEMGYGEYPHPSRSVDDNTLRPVTITGNFEDDFAGVGAAAALIF